MWSFHLYIALQEVLSVVVQQQLKLHMSLLLPKPVLDTLPSTQALQLLHQFRQTESLVRHATSVADVMEAYAQKLGHDADLWRNTGLLHDSDYEQFPDEHPKRIVAELEKRGEEEMVHAIQAHASYTGVQPETDLAKALLACDELTGFVICPADRQETPLTSPLVRVSVDPIFVP